MLLNYRVLLHSVVYPFVVFSLLFPVGAIASPESDASIKQGIRAYDAGEYEKALEYFSEAASE